jgi:hypothetical protein
MAVCRLVLIDATENIGRFDSDVGENRYSLCDLLDVQAFAEYLVDQGITKWPLWDYDVETVLSFCEQKIPEVRLNP